MTDALFRRKAPVVMGWLLRDFPIELEDAAAILGNAGGECGGFTEMQEAHPLVDGSRGGYGWFQWTGPRRVAFETWCNRQGIDKASDEANYGYLCVELRGDEKGAIAALKRAPDLASKVVAFERSFERAGIPHHDSRVRWAQVALEAYGQPKPRQPDVPLPRPRPDIPPEEDPAPAPQPDTPERASPMRRILNAIGSVLTGGGAIALDWRVGALAIAAAAAFIAFMIWLFGRDAVRAWFRKHLA